MGQSGGRGALSRLQASRYADARRRHSRASWRFGAASALASWLSQQSCALACGRCKTGAALPRCLSGSARLRRFLATRSRREAHQLQPSRDGRRHDRSDGTTRPSAVLLDRPRPRRARFPSHVSRSSGTGDEALPPGHVADLLCLDQYDQGWALGTWHWAFLAQPEPFPQTMINAVTPEWFLTNRGGIPQQRPKIVMEEFIRCFTPKTITGACRDYRAGATINFEMDAADKDKKIATPLLVLWGTRGAPPTDEYPTVWRKFASNLETIEPLATGHYIQEEMPEQCLDRFFKLFVA